MKENRSSSFSPDGFPLAFDLPQVPKGFRVEVRTDAANWIGVIYLIDSSSRVVRQMLIALRLFQSNGNEQAFWFRVNPDTGRLDNPDKYKINDLSLERFILLKVLATPVVASDKKQQTPQLTKATQGRPARAPR